MVCLAILEAMVVPDPSFPLKVVDEESEVRVVRSIYGRVVTSSGATASVS